MDTSLNGGDSNTAAAIIEAALMLKVRGWAVIEGVITAHECERYIERSWDWLESLGTGGALRVISFPSNARAGASTGRANLSPHCCISTDPQRGAILQDHSR